MMDMTTDPSQETADDPSRVRTAREDGLKGVLHHAPGLPRHRSDAMDAQGVVHADALAGQEATAPVPISRLREDDGQEVERILAPRPAGVIVPVGEQGLEGYGSTPGAPRAEPLPVTGLDGSPRKLLRRYGASATSILFDTINGLRDLGERARTLRTDDFTEKDAIAAEASCHNIVGKLTLQMCNLLVAKQVHVTVSPKNQSEIADWESYPQEFRDTFDLERAKRAAKTIDVTPQE